jgi:hypothetical protein
VRGSGVFVACVKPTDARAVSPVDTCDDQEVDGSLLAAALAENVNLAEQGTKKQRRVRKQKTTGKGKKKSKRRAMYWQPTIASSRRSTNASVSVVSDVGPSRKASKVDQEFPNVHASSSVREMKRGSIGVKSSAQPLISLQVFGTSLKHFLESMNKKDAKNAAAEQKKSLSTADGSRRWSYPVPNPNVWK